MKLIEMEIPRAVQQALSLNVLLSEKLQDADEYAILRMPQVASRCSVYRNEDYLTFAFYKSVCSLEQEFRGKDVQKSNRIEDYEE